MEPPLRALRRVDRRSGGECWSVEGFRGVHM